MSNSNINSINEFLNTNNISQSLNQTTILSQSTYIPTQYSSSLSTLFYSYEDINSNYIPSNINSTLFNISSLYSTTIIPSNQTGNSLPTTHQNPIPTISPWGGSGTMIPSTHHITWNGNGPQPDGWQPSWGATGTHPPAVIQFGDTGSTGYFSPITSPTPPSYYGNSGNSGDYGHTGNIGHWINKKNNLFTNKFAFENKDFSIKIHYLDDLNPSIGDNKYIKRLYHLQCKVLNIKSILKIDEESFNPIYNKKFDRILEVLEKLSKMNLYYSNICKNLLIQDIFLYKRFNSRFEIEI